MSATVSNVLTAAFSCQSALQSHESHYHPVCSCDANIVLILKQWEQALHVWDSNSCQSHPL